MSEAGSPDTIALLRGLLDVLSEPVALCDGSLRLVALNRHAERMPGFKNGKMIGSPVLDAFAGGVPQELVSADAKRRRYAWRARLLRGHPGATAFDITAAPLEPEGWALFFRHAPEPAVPDFIGQSPATQELLEFVSRIAPTPTSPILIQGESGSGKEIIAKRLHLLSGRKVDRFVTLNCAALPESLLESELFGYSRGAFTDAHTSKPGLLEIADGGTLFLDEIAEMPVGLQAKFLRILEERTFRPLGSAAEISVDVRIVAATNRNLEQAVEDRQFRRDLYYRLNVVRIEIPPLRERADDILLLADFFLRTFAASYQREIHAIAPDAQEALARHVWPGNVRELRNVLERAVVVEPSTIITRSSLAVPDLPAPQSTREHMPPLCLKRTEREMIAAALVQAEGNQTRAAALLGIGRFGLRYKMRQFGMLEHRTAGVDHRVQP